MTPPTAPRTIDARYDPRLVARVVGRAPLRYEEGADPALDRPAHVRAASGLAWVGERLALIQDDANFLALVDPRSGRARSVLLPAGAGGARQFDDGRGNKRHKLDLEAVVAIPREGRTRLLAFGSGSTERRERVAVVDGLDDPGGDPAVAVRPLPALYAALRAAADFAGSEMNVEGAVLAGGALRLFGRGNGAERDGTGPANATCDLDLGRLLEHLARPEAPPPAPERVVRYALDALGGVPLGFTDAAVAAETGDGRRTTIYVAAAEESPDAVRDGAVAGSALGVIVEDGQAISARWTMLLDEHRHPFRAKVEGIALDPLDRRRVWVVVDRDAPEEASEICEVELAGDG